MRIQFPLQSKANLHCTLEEKEQDGPQECEILGGQPWSLLAFLFFRRQYELCCATVRDGKLFNNTLYVVNFLLL